MLCLQDRKHSKVIIIKYNNPKCSIGIMFQLGPNSWVDKLHVKHLHWYGSMTVYFTQTL